MHRLRFFLLFLLLVLCGAQMPLQAASADRPNIVFIIADDLGYGDLSCYGQEKFATPNIDRLASEGLRFTRAYSGHNVCAPSRCVLMTGLHPGHGWIRDNRPAPGFPEGQEPVPNGALTLPLMLEKLGYACGAFGKWGLGPVGSSGDPLKQGFDRFFGFNCQAKAHNYYPTHLWSNDRQVALDNPPFSAHQKLPPSADPSNPASYAAFSGKAYAPDVIATEAQKFVRENKARPFFLFYPTTVPHLALQVPEDSLAPFDGKFPETPYQGERGYLPHPKPHAAYAGMITRMDRDVGRLMKLIADLGLDEKTLFVFTSDNGPLYDRLGGTDAVFFNSTRGLRGHKGSYYEGGIRVPFIVRWKGKIASGTSDRVIAFEDWIPTLCELLDAPEAAPKDLDGLSFYPTLMGKSQQPRPFLYRESPGYGGQQCVRQGDWKLVRQNLNPRPKQKHPPPPTTELFNLQDDPNESADVAAQHPEIVEKLLKIAREQHTQSRIWPIAALDKP